MTSMMAFTVVIFALSFSSPAAVAATSASPSPHGAETSATTEETCDSERSQALHRCAHYTDVGRDRCDATAEKAYEKCLKRIKKPKS